MRTTATIYTDPFSGIELLLVREGQKMSGLAYDPRRSTPPIPWSGNCPHCLAGRHKELSIHTRREIRLLLSRIMFMGKPSYDVPSSTRPCSISHHVTKTKQVATVSGVHQEDTLMVTCRPGSPLTYEGDRRAFQSQILHRCLRLLFSGRPASREELTAILRPLAMQPKRRRARGGRRLICKEIDWAAAIEKIS